MQKQAGAEVRTPYLLKFHDLFPEEIINIDSFLQAFSKDMLLHAAMNLAGYHNHFDRDEDVFQVLHRYFHGKQTEKVSRILNRIYQIQQVSNQAAHFIYPPSSLRLFEYALEKGKDFEDPQDFDQDEGNLNLFKAYLCFNQEIIVKSNNASQLLVDYSSGRVEYLRALAGSVFDNELLNHDLTLEFTTQSQKAQYLFLFLKNTEKTKPLLLQVLKHYGCDSITELFNLTTYLLDAIGYQKDAIIDVRHYPNPKRIIQFIEMFVLVDIEESIDFLSVRNTPIIKVDDGIFKIVYAKFVIDKLFRGWYFTLNRLNDMLKPNERIKNFRSVYTTEFTEEYLLGKLFNKVFPEKAVRLSGKEIKLIRLRNKSKAAAEPDYYVRDYTNIFLIECKDALIKKEVKESLNYLEIESELRSKLVETLNDGKRQSKAIHQILDNIERIKANNIDFDEFDKLSTTRIYPVLILTEEVFNATGLNQLLNEWFQEELKIRRIKSHTTLNKIESLVVVTVDALIYLRPYLIAGRLKFKDILDAYIEKHLVQPSKTKRWSQNRMVSFSLFSRGYIWQRFHDSLRPRISVLVDEHEGLDSP